MQDRPSYGSRPPCIERPRLVKCLNVLVNSHKLSSNRLILSFNFPYQSMVTSIRFRLGTSNRFESAPSPSFKLSNVLFWHDLCTCHLVKAAIKISLFEGSFVESHPGNKAFHNATRCDTLQHTARLQHAASHCNTLQHTATHCNTLRHTATHCNILQHTATHCNTLQHTATHCNAAQFVRSLAEIIKIRYSMRLRHPVAVMTRIAPQKSPFYRNALQDTTTCNIICGK